MCCMKDHDAKKPADQEDLQQPGPRCGNPDDRDAPSPILPDFFLLGELIHLPPPQERALGDVVNQ